MKGLELCFFAGAIAIGDYTEAATVVVLFGVADFLESNCTSKARDAIGAVLALKPDNAVLAATGAPGLCRVCGAPI